MKKLIAISVVFALVAGAAFAADVSAELIGMTDIIKGSTAKSYYSNGSAKPNTVDAGGWPGGLKRIRLDGSGENDEGNFGAWFRFEEYGIGSPTWYGNVWWKPVEQVKFRLGQNPDGDFGADGVTRWGFYQVAGDVGVPKENWAFGAAFYEGWSKNGGLLTLTPAEGLEINLGIPYSDGGEAQDVYLSSTLQIAYTAEGLGKFALTYKSGKGNKKKVADIAADGTESYEYTNDPGKLWLFAGLTMIENLEIDVGFGYKLAATGEAVKFNFPFDIVDSDGDGELDTGEYVGKGTIQDPMAIGLGAHYNAGDFGVKARTQVQIGGKLAIGDIEVAGESISIPAYKIPMNIIFDVLPYYNISDSLAFLFSAGINYTAKSSNEGDKEVDYAKVGFHVTPYITIKSSWWAPNLYVGIDIRTDGKKYEKGAESKDGSTATSWSVPIGIAVAF